MKKLAIKTRFQLGAAAIVVVFCAIISTLFYNYLKDSVNTTVHKEAEIFLQAADATRLYVKDVLRPRMNALLPRDAFIPQAMSTSYVGREIMGRIRERFPEFIYKRAADNPVNPVNRVDAFEREMLEWFRRNPQGGEWQGVIGKQGRAFFARLKPIHAEADCLVCHGDPALAPGAMIELYGSDGGFNYRVGDVVAADTIYIPVDVSFGRIKEAAWLVFLLAICSLVFLLSLFHLLFNRTVVAELKGVLGSFRGISGKAAPPAATTPRGGAADEFEQLKGAFEEVAVDLKQAHEELKASESKYRLLFENSREAILIVDLEGRLTDLNPAAVALFGFRDRQEALAPGQFFRLFSDARVAESFFRVVRERGFVQGLEVGMVDREGRGRETLLSATVRAGQEGAPRAVEIMIHDVTEKRRIEKYLARTEKMASIGQLAAGVAHEINNPLGVITCYANLLARGLAPGTQALKDVLVIRKHADHCKAIIEDLLRFARVSAPRKHPADIHALIEEVLSVLAPEMEKGGVRVTRRFAEGAPRLTVDAQQMRQVFMNLMINAVQAMPAGGELTVRTRVDQAGRRLSVAFVDTGHGIPARDRERVFDPFFTTKAEGQGTGLGLSVSYGIVSRHGGRIEVDAAAGGGTRFTLWLPFGDEHPQKGS